MGNCEAIMSEQFIVLFITELIVYNYFMYAQLFFQIYFGLTTSYIYLYYLFMINKILFLFEVMDLWKSYIKKLC